MARKKKRKIRIFRVLFFIICIAFICIFISKSKTYNEEKKEIDNPKEETVVEEKENELSLIMAGDCLIHGALYEDKKTGNTYDFRGLIENIKFLVSSHDLAFYNQESILGGSELGLSTYPRFNSPYEVGDAFIEAGFNLVSLANNHTLDRGKQAIRNSLAYWKKHDDIMVAGSYESEEARVTPNIKEKNGIKYALLSYTTTTNGLPTYKDEPYLITVYDKDKVKEDVNRLRDKVDLLIVAMHWGEEYTATPVQEQKEIANYLASLGVNLIIGHHPHVIEPVEFIGDTMVVYSLGNLVSAQQGIDRLSGLMVSVNIKKVTENGKSKIEFEDAKSIITYTYADSSPYRHNYKLYLYSQLNDKLLPNYKSYYDKYQKIVTKYTDRITPVGF